MIVGGSLEGPQTNLLQQSIDEISRKNFKNTRRMLKVLKEVKSLNKFLEEMNSRYLEIVQEAADILDSLRRENRSLTPSEEA